MYYMFKVIICFRKKKNERCEFICCAEYQLEHDSFMYNLESFADLILFLNFIYKLLNIEVLKFIGMVLSFFLI